jgi:hypothetical protein
MSPHIPGVSIIEAFQSVIDPRVDRCKKHSLWEILIIALGSTITGGKGWEDMVFFAEEHFGHWASGTDLAATIGDFC